MLAGAALNRDPQLRLQGEDDIRSGEEEHSSKGAGPEAGAERCKWGVKVVLTNDIIRVDTVDTVSPWTRRLETPPLGPGLCRAERRHSASQDTETGDTIAPVLSSAVKYKDNGEDSKVWDVLTRSPILCTDPGLELESGDTISGGSFCAGAGLVLGALHA